jgi:protein-S-isoprenylcysteine O-methyltransferase Ste14
MPLPNSPDARLGQFLFSNRSYLPIPLFVLIIFFARFDAPCIIAGVLVSSAGEALRLAGSGYGAYRGAGELLTSGIYSHFRNPLYAGNILLGSGFALGSGGLIPWLPLGYFVLIAIYYGFIIRAEEAELYSRFGEKYAEYCRAVPRFFPRLSRYKNFPAERPFLFRFAWRREKWTFLAIIVLCSCSALWAVIKSFWLHWSF